MSAPDLPIVAKLVNSGWISQNSGEESRVPYEAAEVIKKLYEALDQIDTWLRGGDGNGQELMLKAGDALSRARGEEVGNG